MTGLKILALTPIIGAATITATVPPPAIEYGALALCGAVVMFLCGYLKTLTAQHKEERQSLVKSLEYKDATLAELTKQNTKAYDRLSALLIDRPCLFKDSRISEPQ